MVKFQRYVLNWMWVAFGILWATIPAVSLGQAVTVTIDPKDPKVGEEFQYIIRSEQAFEPEGFPITTNDNIRLLRPQYEWLSQTNIIQGVQTQSYSATWYFKALREGPFEIGSVKVRLKGAQSQEVPSVTGNISSVEQAQIGQFRNIGRVNGDRRIVTQFGDRYFTAVEISNKTPYLYEPFEVRTVLYCLQSDINVRSRFNVVARGGGSHALPIENSSSLYNPLKPEPIEIDGRKFVRIPLERFLAVPTKAGEVEVRGSEIQISISADDFFMMRTITIPIGAAFDNIEVKPLPEVAAGVITRLVGDFTVKSEVDRAVLGEGDLVTISIRISGRGFLETASLDNFPQIDGIAFVSEEVVSSNNQPASELISVKTFKRVYQVTRGGVVQIPSLQFAMFNPESGEYVMRSTEPVSIKANAADKSSLSITVSGAQQDRGKARVLADSGGILHIDKAPLSVNTIAAAGAPLAVQPLYLGLHAASLVLVIATALFSARQRRLNQDAEFVRSRNAQAKAQAALKEARAMRGDAPAGEFYSALSAGIRNHVASIVRREASGMTNEEIGQALRGRGASDEVAREIVILLDRCDESRYAPASGEMQRGEDLKFAETLLNSLGRNK